MKISRGKIIGAQKVVVYGPEGIGKSTFAAQFPNPVFIDTEGSTKHMDVARTPKPSSWTMLLEQVRYFKANPFELNTLNIDTADWAEQLCIEEICAKAQKKSIEDFGYGKGYVYLAEEFGRLLNLLEELVELGINVVITAHAQMRKFEQPDEMGSYDRWEMKLQKKTAPLLKEWADMVLFANYKTYVVNVDNQGLQKGKNKAQGGKRVMYTTHHPCWDAKNRHNLDLELELDYKEIAHCIVVKGGASNPQLQYTVTDINPEPHREVQQFTQTKSAQELDNFRNETKGTEGSSSANESRRTGEVESSNIPNKEEVPKESENVAETMKKNDEKYNIQQTPENDLEGVPKPLADLMLANNVTIEEIQQAVASRGYYPGDTPIENYDPNFVSGVLVGAWGQVFEIIKEIRRDIESTPF